MMINKIRYEFIPTTNYQNMQELCENLISSHIGIEIGPVIGRAGRGKTTAAIRLLVHNSDYVYCRYEGGWTLKEMLQDIAFKLTGSRPARAQGCREAIKVALNERRRLIMMDEADRMSVKMLNILRDIHDICHAPIVIIGEELLWDKLNQERRLIDRTVDPVYFEPVKLPDIFIIYNKLFGCKLTPELAKLLLEYSGGGEFRLIMKDARAIYEAMAVSGLSVIDVEVVNNVLRKRARK